VPFTDAAACRTSRITQFSAINQALMSAVWSVVGRESVMFRLTRANMPREDCSIKGTHCLRFPDARVKGFASFRGRCACSLSGKGGESGVFRPGSFGGRLLLT
jgi:hypothetical protein